MTTMLILVTLALTSHPAQAAQNDEINAASLDDSSLLASAPYQDYMLIKDAGSGNISLSINPNRIDKNVSVNFTVGVSRNDPSTSLEGAKGVTLNTEQPQIVPLQSGRWYIWGEVVISNSSLAPYQNSPHFWTHVYTATVVRKGTALHVTIKDIDIDGRETVLNSEPSVFSTEAQVLGPLDDLLYQDNS